MFNRTSKVSKSRVTRSLRVFRGYFTPEGNLSLDPIYRSVTVIACRELTCVVSVCY